MIKNYPDMSRRHLIVNAPFFINVVLAFIFAFIPERTKKKVRARWSAGRAGARTATADAVASQPPPRLPPAGSRTDLQLRPPAHNRGHAS